MLNKHVRIHILCCGVEQRGRIFQVFYAKPLNIPAACRIAERHIVNIVHARTTFFLLGSGTEEQHIYYS
jgi:hypothetical protein